MTDPASVPRAAEPPASRVWLLGRPVVGKAEPGQLTLDGDIIAFVGERGTSWQVQLSELSHYAGGDAGELALVTNAEKRLVSFVPAQRFWALRCLGVVGWLILGRQAKKTPLGAWATYLRSRGIQRKYR